MTFICLICKEAITSQSDYQITNLGESCENVIITTKCGHLYHKACLRQYFSVQKSDDEENGRKTSPTLCPKCQRFVVLENTIQIYPEDDEDAYYSLLKEKCDIYRENLKLKAHNEDLCNELKTLKETLNKQNDKNQHTAKKINCNLKPGDKIISFKENEPLGGTVQSIGYYNYNSLHANILYESDDIASLVPVAGLILRKDFYYEEDTPTIKNAFTNSEKSEHNEQVSDKDADKIRTSKFERSLLIFNTDFHQTMAEMKKLREEVDIFASEQIDGVVFFIESQKVKAASLKRQLISLDSSIQELKTTQRDLAYINETEKREDEINIDTGEYISQLLSEKEKALAVLRDTLKLYNAALPQVQKIKSFIKAGFLWLDILETNVKKLLEEEFPDQIHIQDQLISIDKEMKSRRFLIATITQAVKKFKAIPNSKLALKDHNLLDSTFSRFKTTEEDFETRKASLDNFL